MLVSSIFVATADFEYCYSIMAILVIGLFQKTSIIKHILLHANIWHILEYIPATELIKIAFAKLIVWNI